MAYSKRAFPVCCLAFRVQSGHDRALIPAMKPFMGGGRPRFWVTLLILLLLVIPAGLGQWDMVVAVIIGLIVGNGLAFLRGQ
jgi:hypothetical protein